MLKQVKYSDTQKRDFVYDNADRVSNITNTIGGNSESFDYGYDANSNRESEIRKADGQTFRSLDYQYDKLDRLSQVKTTTPNGTNPAIVSQIDYTYDAVGNRKTEIGTDQNGVAINRSATFDALNQLTNLTNGSLAETFDYDLNGNLSSHKQNGTEVERFEYDVRNQLTRVANGANTELATFDYDFERKRLSKTSANFRTDYVYAGSQIVSEFQNNVASANYTIGAGEIIKSDFTVEGSRFYFSDALGSTTSLADNQGSLIARNEYDAFGVQSSSGNTGNAIGYTGQRLDYETGLMALGNGERYYSPSYARFIQQDSFAGVSNIPQSLNRFSYVHNNPNKYTDPSGNIIPLLVYGIALIVIAAVSTSTVERHAAHNLEGEEKGWAQNDPRRSWGAALGDGSGMTKIVNAAVGQDVYTGRDLGWKERAWQGTIGAIEVIGNATGVSGAIFKAGSLVINVARGGDELLNLGRGAWSSIKNIEPAVADAKAVVDAVRNPFRTTRAGWEATKDTYQAAKSTVGNLFEGGTKQTAKRAWEFTRERLNPFNYERDGANINFKGGNNIESSVIKAGEKAREIEIENPVFDTLDETLKHRERFKDPQKYINDFIGNLQDDFQFSVKPTYDPTKIVPFQAGGAITTPGQEAINIGEVALRRDSELFKTLVHEEYHHILARRAIEGSKRAGKILENLDFEERFVERNAIRVYNNYIKKYGEFEH